MYSLTFYFNSLSDISSYNIIICIIVCVFEARDIANYIIWIKLIIIIGTARFN